MKTITLPQRELIGLFTENANTQIKLSGSLIASGPLLNRALNSTVCKTVKATVGWTAVDAPPGKGREAQYRVRVIDILEPTRRQVARSIRACHRN